MLYAIALMDFAGHLNGLSLECHIIFMLPPALILHNRRQLDWKH